MRPDGKISPMSKQDGTEIVLKNDGFWHHAATYTSQASHDSSFVNEMAYMIVTLHRTGA